MTRQELVQEITKQFDEDNDIFSVQGTPNGAVFHVDENWEALLEDFMENLKEDVTKDIWNF